ncbi:histidine kinase N-terminal 7TM domain-containing protein [Salinigranum marinum]|uniref:sensor histidine kinase n=1 Tax=Salinigranum marinum TaxID=1515595 RepID=UPI002989A847|nr:histidine kinase N-terminal 7TM domain-containing protein [Salinigranum marinum]
MTGGQWAYSPHVVPFLVSALVSTVLAVYIARHPRTDLTDRTALTLTVLLVLAAEWSVAYLFRLISVGQQAKLTWVLVEYAGSGFLPVGWFLLAVEYAGYGSRLTPRRVVLLTIEPFLAFLLVATNPTHQLMWTDVQLAMVGSITVLDRAFGPWFYLHIAYSYTLIVVGSVLFVKAFVGSERPYRGQIAALTGAVVAPFAGNVGFVFDLGFFSRIEFTSAGFTVACAFLAFAIVRYRLLDLTPISHAVTVGNIRDAYVVVNREHRVVYVNPAAGELFDVDPGSIGGSVEATLPIPTELFVEWESEPIRREVVIEREGEKRYLDGVVTPIVGSRMRGWSVIFRDVTERRKRERELRRQNERLDEFASVVAHDLRNPMNVAQGRVALAREGSENEHLEIAAESLRRIETIIDDTLTLARQGKSVGELESVGLQPVVEQCWGIVSTADAELTVEGTLTVRADPGRLRHIVENLLRNAVEHGGDDVTVRVGPLADGFYVEDDGPGVPDEIRGAVFEPGYTDSRGGVGLGLTIVKRIAEAHGWSVTLTEGRKRGARFEFTGVDVASSGPREPAGDGGHESRTE